MRRRADEKGLTLLEVLVAVGILSVVLAAIYGTFFSVHRAAVSSDGEMLRLRSVRVFFDLIKREIESAYLNAADDNTFFTVKDRDIYGKKASELRFTTFAPYGSGLFYIEYSLDKDTGVLYKKAGGLWRDREPERIDVLEDIDEFQVEARINGRWIGTVNTGLPSAVRVSITLGMKGDAVTLRETVTPKLGG